MHSFMSATGEATSGQRDQHSILQQAVLLWGLMWSEQLQPRQLLQGIQLCRDDLAPDQNPGQALRPAAVTDHQCQIVLAC